jgi:hypothetical protein
MRKVFLALLAASLLPTAIALAETPAEKQMAQTIGQHLKESGELRNYRIGIRFKDGVAHLEGTVTSPQQRRAAIELAKQVKGVSKVDYKLEVANSETPQEPKETPVENRHQLAEALDRAAVQTSAQEDTSSNVVHAYRESGEAPPMQMRRQAMMPNNGARMSNMGMRRGNMPVPAPLPRMMPVRQANAMAPVQQAGGACVGCGPAMGPPACGPGGMGGAGACPAPSGFVPQGSARGPSYENAQMPGYAWPSYASYPNYAALTYPQQYSPTAWPYIGPFYPYPQVPLAWRKVSLEWDDGWWFLDFSSHNSSH